MAALCCSWLTIRKERKTERMCVCVCVDESGGVAVKLIFYQVYMYELPKKKTNLQNKKLAGIPCMRAIDRRWKKGNSPARDHLHQRESFMRLLLQIR
jgi:hypothetical protein